MGWRGRLTGACGGGRIGTVVAEAMSSTIEVGRAFPVDGLAWSIGWRLRRRPDRSCGRWTGVVSHASWTGLSGGSVWRGRLAGACGEGGSALWSLNGWRELARLDGPLRFVGWHGRSAGALAEIGIGTVVAGVEGPVAPEPYNRMGCSRGTLMAEMSSTRARPRAVGTSRLNGAALRR